MATKYSEQIQKVYANNIPYVRKNLIINGAMDIWQRGSATQTNITSPMAALGPDRFTLVTNSAMTAVASIVQGTSKPTGTFNYSFRVNCTTADTSLASTDQSQIRYRIEGYDISKIAGKVCTLSFWVRSNAPGTYSVGLSSSGNDRCYVSEYTIDSGDLWQFKTMTFTMHDLLSGTWDTINGVGLAVRWSLGAGSTYQTSTLDTWQTTATLINSSTNQTNFWSSNSNYFFIKNVQLELGPEATNFEYRQISEELNLCRRYCQIIHGGCGAAASSTSWEGTISLAVPMCSTPNIVTLSAAAKVEDPSTIAYTQSAAAIALLVSTEYGVKLQMGNFTGLPLDIPLTFHTNGGYAILSAEL